MIDIKCGCGKPVCYTLLGGNGSCNKYQRCVTYEELLKISNRLTQNITVYGKAINHIDDYFEYKNESLKDRKKVHQILGNLTDKLKEINYD